MARGGARLEPRAPWRSVRVRAGVGVSWARPQNLPAVAEPRRGSAPRFSWSLAPENRVLGPALRNTAACGLGMSPRFLCVVSRGRAGGGARGRPPPPPRDPFCPKRFPRAALRRPRGDFSCEFRSDGRLSFASRVGQLCSVAPGSVQAVLGRRGQEPGAAGCCPPSCGPCPGPPGLPRPRLRSWVVAMCRAVQRAGAALRGGRGGREWAPGPQSSLAEGRGSCYRPKACLPRQGACPTVQVSDLFFPSLRSSFRL